MKRLSLLFLAVLLTSCMNGIITPASYNAAFELCKPHGGLVWVAHVEGKGAHDVIKIVCKDNDIIAFRSVKIAAPELPATAASQGTP